MRTILVFSRISGSLELKSATVAEYSFPSATESDVQCEKCVLLHNINSRVIMLMVTKRERGGREGGRERGERGEREGERGRGERGRERERERKGGELWWGMKAQRY